MLQKLLNDDYLSEQERWVPSFSAFLYYAEITIRLRICIISQLHVNLTLNFCGSGSILLNSCKKNQVIID